MRSENITETESVNTTPKSHKKGRVIATATLAAGVALVAAGGFAGVVNPWNMGTLTVGSWKSDNLPDKVVSSVSSPGAYTLNADNSWSSGTKAKLSLTNSDTKTDYVVKMDVLKDLWFNHLKKTDNSAADAATIAALKKHTTLSAWNAANNNTQLDSNGVVALPKAKDDKNPTKVEMEFWMKLTDAKSATNDVAKEMEPLKGAKIDKTDFDPGTVVVKKP